MKVEEIQLNAEDIIGNLDPEKLEKVAFILKTISHPMRISIIGLLAVNEKLCVNDICEKLRSEQSLTSHHLANMKLSGILGSVREGKNIFYYLKLKEVITVITCMNKCQIL
jgi:ArsR family transcriptional regulator